MQFQSTCPRGARQPRGPRCGQHCISIHVPAWGTTKRLKLSYSMIYFNPRPAWGTTLQASIYCSVGHFNPRARWAHDMLRQTISSPPSFQSRARVGHDLRTSGGRGPGEFQSTCPRRARHSHGVEWFYHFNHVPAWGTTFIAGASRSTDFNPRARVGHDWVWRVSRPHFNPRARVGTTAYAP